MPDALTADRTLNMTLPSWQAICNLILGNARLEKHHAFARSILKHLVIVHIQTGDERTWLTLAITPRHQQAMDCAAEEIHCKLPWKTIEPATKETP